MIGFPSGAVLTRAPWWEAVLRRWAQRWLAARDPRTLYLGTHLDAKITSTDQWLDRLFPPP